jgi:hypothetical protein
MAAAAQPLFPESKKTQFLLSVFFLHFCFAILGIKVQGLAHASQLLYH